MSRSTLLRQWALLQTLSRRYYTSTSDLHQKIVDQGFSVNKRTIERDLAELELVFPLDSKKNSRPYGWRWSPVAGLMDIPGMDPATALSFKLVEQHLERLMPRATLKHLEPHFSCARDVLEKAKGPLQSWTEKVQVISRGQRLLEPAIAPEILEAVYSALLEEKQFKLRYRTKSREEKDYLVHPLGLVLRDQVAYLVCTLFDYGDAVQLVLHRMLAVEVLPEPAQRPEDFSLSGYIQSQRFDYPAGGTIQLDVLFAAAAAQHLTETPLSVNQRLETQPDGRVRLRAEVVDTQQLRWWLLGFGDQVEVLGPVSLREEFANIVARLRERYMVEA